MTYPIEKNMEYTRCNICQEDDSLNLFAGRDRLHGLSGIFNVVQCRHCGLIYLNPRPDQDEMALYYPSNYEPYVGRIQAKRNWLSRIASVYGLEKMCRAVTAYKSSGGILDIGCATGDFLKRMQIHGWNVFGVERDLQAIQTAKAKHGLDLFQGTLQEARFPNHFFDAVTLWHALEHLPDPMGALAEIKRILKPGGLLVITVPNVESWDAKLFKGAWAGYDVPRHLYTFSPKTLTLMLTRNRLPPFKNVCLYGSYQAFIWSVLFYVQGRWENPAWFQKMSPKLNALPLRLLAGPYFRVVDLFKKSAAMTFFCRPDPEQV